MHDNTFVFPLALSWLRCYPGNLFSQLCTDFGISNKTKKNAIYGFSWSQVRRQRVCCRVLCSLLRLALLRFSNLWANLDLESRQQLTHTHTHTHIHVHNAPICWGRGDLCLLCWQPCRSTAVEGEKVYGDVSGNCLGSSWETFLVTVIGTEP